MHFLTVSYNEQVVEDGWIGQFSPNDHCHPFFFFFQSLLKKKTTICIALRILFHHLEIQI